MSNSTRIAIPSALPGGLQAGLGQHFGHCDLYTIVDVEGGKVTAVSTLPNVPHQQGGCMAPVQHLASNGVNALIAGGMGLRPLMGFNQVGIEVYHGGIAEDVDSAVKSWLLGALPRFTRDQTCGGH
nr:NifB/NifX family molybdenum-iron cluster-binding protein [uncultured Holophaga sp.]